MMLPLLWQLYRYPLCITARQRTSASLTMEEPPRPAIPSHVRELSVDNPLYDDPSSPMAVPKLLSANAIAPGVHI